MRGSLREASGPERGSDRVSPRHGRNPVQRCLGLSGRWKQLQDPESSDAQVTVEPGNGTVELSIESSVIHQFGKQIKATVLETLNRLDVKDAKVTVVDKGALDCTLKARVECAVYRSNDITENLPWGGVIK